MKFYCNTCAHYSHQKGLPNDVGQCRFNPPQIVLAHVPVDSAGKRMPHNVMLQPAAIIEQSQQYFPLVGAMEWCGQHAPMLKLIN